MSSENAKSVLLNALEIASPEARRAYLSAQCGNDQSLRAEVDDLLQHHEQIAPLSASGTIMKTTAPPAERLGTEIGPYKLRQQIGEGGMGVVYMAEQSEPIARRVALKIIKPGMDSRQVIARFEAERHALALMDHVNIARVLDAGTTLAGRPYFVMELVHGVPITKYCDDNRLTPRQRLELFVPVCQAIQHAHQKGIIHRDIKPSNVMVTLYDGKPVPKVIDFGVAKATEQKLTTQTLFTQYGTMVGTLEYMSPEQAEMSALGVDTRSDIYSLGVLLYELLTGSTPLSHQRVKEAAYAEILRLIREEDPPKPSTRLSDSGEALASISAQRHTEPAKLSKLMRGELDWIVMKTLEKDRNRRYESANGFAADVQRYLSDEPVQACPPSAAYRFHKFARRNKGPVLAVSLILLVLIAGIVGTSIGLIRAEKARLAESEQRQLAESNEQKALTAAAAEKKAKETAEARAAETRAVLDFVENKVFAAARPEGEQGGLGREVTLRTAVEAALPFVETSFREQPNIEAHLRMTLGIAYLNLGEASKAAEQCQKARILFTQHSGPEHPDTLASMSNLARCYADLGRYTDAFQLREETLALLKATLGPNHPETLASMRELADSYRDLGKHAEALNLNERTLKLSQAKLGPDHPDTLRTMVSLANNYEDHGRNSDALELREKTLALVKVKMGRDHSNTLVCMNNLANSYNRLGRHAEALKLYEETLDLCKAKLGPDHPHTLMAKYNLAEGYTRLNHDAEALKLYEETLVLYKTKLGHDHPGTLRTMGALAGAQDSLGEYVDALKLSQETLALSEGKLGPDHPQTLLTMWRVVRSLRHLNRAAEAEALIEECLKRAEGKVVDPKMIIDMKTIQLIPRIRHFEQTKDASGCRATAEMFERLQPSSAYDLYHAACFRAITAKVVKFDPKTPAADADRLARDETDRAMAWLTQAIAAGHKDVALIQQDQDLNALRDRDDFKKLVAEQLGLTETTLRKAIRLQPDKPDLHLRLGQLFYSQGRFAEAESCYREVIRLQPDLAAGHRELGQALRDQKRFEEAETALREAIRLQPDLLPAHAMLGWMLQSPGKFVEMESAFRDVLRLKPDDACGHHGLGRALLGQKRPSEGIASLREAIRLGSTDHWVHAALGWALVEQGEPAEGEAEFREVIRLKADLVGGHFGLGRALVDQKKFAAAETVLREVIRLEPQHPWAHQLLGLALTGQGKSAEAKELLKKNSEQKVQESVKTEKPE
jgi:serine/threonine protein kinase/tetratricopeptide (TPR) repeat protein